MSNEMLGNIAATWQGMIGDSLQMRQEWRSIEGCWETHGRSFKENRNKTVTST